MEGASCPNCGAAKGPGDRFCGSCGADLTAVPSPPAKPAPAAAPVPAAGPSPQKLAQKTMLGMMSPLAGAPNAASPSSAPKPHEPVSPADTPQAAPTPVKAAGGGVHARTMMGMPKGIEPPSSGTSTVVEPGALPGKLLTEAVANQSLEPGGRKRTVFGVDEEASGATRLEKEAAKPAAAPAAARPPAATNRTMLGVSPLAAQASTAAPAAKPAISPQSQLTMLGSAPAPIQPSPSERPRSATPAASAPASSVVSTAAMPAPTPPASTRRREDGSPRSFTPVPGEQPVRDSRDSSAMPKPPVKRGLGWLLALIAVVVLGLGAFAFWFLTRAPEVNARVVATPTGDALQVEVPGSKPGSKVRFAGEEHPLTAGRAQFALRPDGLALGDNALAVSVVHPNGDVDTSTVHLAVDYRVRADLGALSSAQPGVDVVVDARPGAKVTLDGAPVALDARGHGVKHHPVPPQAATTFVLRARYRVELPGATPADGEVHVSLPVTSAQIDRPGPSVVTDQQTLEIAGAVENTAEVTVEGQKVAVTDGRFLHRVTLPQPGEYDISVVARAPGKAPRVIPVHARRVADMTTAAAAFKHDPTLTYARIVQNPLIYRGQNVAFDGRVYNVEVQGGRSVLQMLVLACPGGARCPLWVEYPQATEATVDTWVRVLGTVAGEQQFRSKQGQVQTVPSVQAQYVLKLAR